MSNLDPADNRLLALVVDDDRNIREMLTDALESYGFEVLDAADGQEAWTLFEMYDPHLIITDIYMPKKNGLMLLKQIKQVAPRRTVILITGYHHYRQLVETAEFQPDGFLSKPFRIDDLYSMIGQILNDASHRA